MNHEISTYKDYPAIDFDLEVAKGTIAGHSKVTKFGFVKGIHDTQVTVWAPGGQYVVPSGAEQLNLASTDVADDKDDGTGARKVLISGLDGNYNRISEEVELNGTANVLTVNSYLFIKRMRLILSGSGKKNAGVITATQESSSAVLANIPLGYGVTQQMVYCIPAGEEGFLKAMYLSSVKTSATEPTVTFQLIHYFPELNSEIVLFEDTFDTAVENSRTIESFAYNNIAEKTYLILRASSSASNTDVFARFWLDEVIMV